MNQAAYDRVIPIRTPNGDIRGYTVRGHHGLVTGIYLTMERAYEEALIIELNRRWTGEPGRGPGPVPGEGI